MPPFIPTSDLTIPTSSKLSIHLTYSTPPEVVNMSSQQQEQDKIRILILNPNSSKSMTEGMRKSISTLNLPEVCLPLSFFSLLILLLTDTMARIEHRTELLHSPLGPS